MTNPAESKKDATPFKPKTKAPAPKVREEEQTITAEVVIDFSSPEDELSFNDEDPNSVEEITIEELEALYPVQSAQEVNYLLVRGFSRKELISMKNDKSRANSARFIISLMREYGIEVPSFYFPLTALGNAASFNDERKWDHKSMLDVEDDDDEFFNEDQDIDTRPTQHAEMALMGLHR